MSTTPTPGGAAPGSYSRPYPPAYQPPSEPVPPAEVRDETFSDEARREAHVKVQHARTEAAGTVDSLAESARLAAEQLKRDDHGKLSEYVSGAAERMARMSTSLREKSGDELMHEIGRLAREQPALFITGGIALGFGLSRFAKASAPSRELTAASDLPNYNPAMAGAASQPPAGGPEVRP